MKETIYIVFGVGKSGTASLWNSIISDERIHLDVSLAPAEAKRNNVLHLHNPQSLIHIVHEYYHAYQFKIIIPVRLDIKKQEISRFFQYCSKADRLIKIKDDSLIKQFTNYLMDPGIKKMSSFEDNGLTFYENKFHKVFRFLGIEQGKQLDFDTVYAVLQNVEVIFITTENISKNNAIVYFVGIENFRETVSNIRQNVDDDQMLINILLSHDEFKKGILRIENYINTTFNMESDWKVN